MQGFLCSYGAEDRGRTGDLLLGKEMLYQLSHFRVTTHYAEITATVKTPQAFVTTFLDGERQLTPICQAGCQSGERTSQSQLSSQRWSNGSCKRHFN